MNPRYVQRIQQARRRVARGRRRVERESARLIDRLQMAINWRIPWHGRPVPLLLGAVGVGMAASQLLANSDSRQRWERWLFDIATASVWSRIWREWAEATVTDTAAKGTEHKSDG